MIPLPISVFIYQIITLIGLLAIGRIVMAISSRTEDLDIRLMYSQKLVDIFKSSKKFKMSVIKRSIVYLLILLSIIVSFLPTLLILSADHKLIPSNSVRSLDLNDIRFNSKIIGGYNSIYKLEKRPIDNYGTNSTPSFSSIIEGHLKTLGAYTEYNPTGFWIKTSKSALLGSDKLNKMHLTNRDNFQPHRTTPPFFVNPSGESVYQFGNTSDSNMIDLESSSLKYCVENNNLFNLTDIEGHKVRAVDKFSTSCLPVYDPSLSITHIFQKSIFDDSFLNFRQPKLNEGYVRSDHLKIGRFGSGYGAKITIVIKKTTRITVYYPDLNQLLVENCTDKLKSDNNGIHYTQFPDTDKIICNLELIGVHNSSLPIIQATRRLFKDNHVVNSVYTYFKDTDQQGHGYTADLTSFSTYELFYDTREGDIEFLIANILTNSNSTSAANSDLVKFPQLDSQDDIDLVLDLVISKAGFLSYFSSLGFMTQFEAKIVLSVIETKTLWLALIIALPLLFLFIVILSNFGISKHYKTDLRTLLIQSLNQQEKNIDMNRNEASLPDNIKPAMIDLLKHRKCKELTINQVPITLQVVDSPDTV